MKIHLALTAIVVTSAFFIVSCDDGDKATSLLIATSESISLPSGSTTPEGLAHTQVPPTASKYPKVSNGIYDMQVIKVERTYRFQDHVPSNSDEILVIIVYETTDPSILAHDSFEARGKLQSPIGQSWEPVIVSEGRGVLNGKRIDNNTCVYAVPKDAIVLEFILKDYPPVKLNF